MRSKNLTLIFASILAVFLLTGFGSAVDLTDINMISSPENVSHDKGNFGINFNLTNGGPPGTLNWSYSNFTSSQKGLEFSFSDDYIGNGSSTEITEEYTATISFDKHQSGTIEGNIGVRGEGESSTTSLTFSVNILNESSLKFSKKSYEIPQDSKSINIKLINNGNVDLNGINLTSSGDFKINFSKNNFNLDAGNSTDVTVTMISSVNSLHLGKNKIKIKASSNQASTSTDIIYDKSYSWNVENIDDEFKINDFELVLNKGFGDEDKNEFYPLDKITAEFEIENAGGWDADEEVDIEDIEIEACLYDEKNKDCILDEDDMELTNNDFDLDDGKKKDMKVDFKIDPSELSEGDTDFRFYIKATGKTDSDDDSYDENKTAVSHYEKLEIKQDEFVVIDDLKISSPANQDSYNCGSEIQVKGDIWNIGESDLEKDEVFIRVYNEELGINEVIDVNDLDSLDYLPLDSSLEIPEGIDEKPYKLDFVVYDDYKNGILSNNDIYELDNEDNSKATYNLFLDVKGQCSIPQVSLSETALSSGEYSGDTFKINTTLSNSGEDFTNYSLTASEYSDWAYSVEFSEQLFSLEPGESKNIQVNLNAREDVSGDKTFNLEVYSGNELVTKQPVQISIKEKPQFLGINWKEINLITILAIAIAIVLIAIIIVLLIRLSQKNKTASA